MSESTVKAQQCFKAFVDGNYDESLSLLDQVEEPYKLKDDKYGATMLHWAATKGWLNTVQLLLDKYEFHPLCKTCNGNTSLHSASKNGHLDVVQYLITECKCDPMCKNNDGFVPLHSASLNGHLDVIQYLITECKCDPMCKSNNGLVPLHNASSKGHLNVVQYLITECKCDPMCKSNNGVVPLHSASLNGHLDVIQYLITECKCDPMCKDNDGVVPLHLASLNGHLDVIQYLITECKCDPMCKSNNGVVPLHLASLNGHLDVVQYLITECKCDPMCKNNDGVVPLHSASQNGHLDVVQYLITQCKCDPMCKSNNGLVPLHNASSKGHLNVVQYLITECKCDPMCKSNNGVVPLHSASQNGHLDVVQYLITECKCDPMCKSNNGFVPLHSACINSHLPIIEYLLSTGRVNPETKNFIFQSPLDLVEQNRVEVEKVFAKFSKLKTCFSVDSYVNVVLLGNPGAGKSTLAQVIIQTSSGRHLLGWFRKVEGVELHTAGIVPARIEHKELGNIILHDLAGQAEYYSSHIAVLENLLQDYPAIFINFVNLHEEEALTSLHKWITVIENVSQNVQSPCHVITVASHVDTITPNEFFTVKKQILEILSSRLECCNILNVGLMGLDCRKLDGDGFSSFMIAFTKSCRAIRNANSINTNLYCRMLYTFLESKSKRVYRLDKLCHLMSFSKVTENHFVPHKQEEILETLSSLHSTGLITLLKNENTPGNSWVVVDKRVLLAEVNGVLFAPEKFKQYHDISSNTGIITRSALTRMFRKYDSEMLIHFLSYMKLSMEITSDMLMYTNLQRKQPENPMVEEKYLFIPALIRNVPRPHKMSGTIQFGWCLQCSNPHQFFLPHFLHVLLLHLAYQYALPKTADNRRCTIWTNGILWSDNDGVQTLVEIVDNSRCVLLLMSCELGFEHNMIKLRKDVIKDILSHQKHICPRLELQEFIIDPSQLHYPIDKPSSLTLYDIENIAFSVVRNTPFVVSYNVQDKRSKLSDLLPHEYNNGSELSVLAGRYPQELSAGLVSGIGRLTLDSDNHTDSSPCAAVTSHLVEEALLPDISLKDQPTVEHQIKNDVLLTETLVPDDLTSILDDIDDLRPNYEKLGTFLGIRQPDIEVIKIENHYDVWTCLKNVINMWLNRKTTTSEIPNRRLLVEAIRKINQHLAITLEEKYTCMIKGST